MYAALLHWAALIVNTVCMAFTTCDIQHKFARQSSPS